MTKAALLLFACCLLCGIADQIGAMVQTNPANQEQTVRLKSELIDVRAVVADRNGKVVTSLKKDDFEVLEDGKPQTLAFFSLEGAPRQADAAREGIQGPASSMPTRTIVLFVDTLHISSVNYARIKKALRKVISEQIADGDVAALVTSGGPMGLFNQFTRDRRLLVYALQRISPQGQGIVNSRFTPYLAAMIESGDPEALNLGIAATEAEEGGSLVLIDRRAAEAYTRNRARVVLAEAARWRNAALSTLEAIAAQMAEMPGQRVLFYISEGFSLRGNGGLDTGDLTRATSRAVRSGVAIYALDAKGLDAPLPFGDISLVGAPPPGSHSYAAAARSDQQSSLNALAKDTGGEAIFNTNDLQGAMKKVMDSSSTYYTLAYYPLPGKNNGRFHQIAVRVKNHPEYTVRTQRGYLASDARSAKLAAKGPQDPVVKAIVSPVPATGIGVAATAYFMEGDTDDAQVSLEAYIDGAQLQYHQTEDRYGVDVEVTTMVFDAAGNSVKKITDTIKGNLSRERVEQAKVKGLRYAKRLTLDPGTYHIRLAVRERESERIGTAMAWIEVPNIRRGKLTLSSVLLGERRTNGNAAAGNDAFQHNLLRGIPFIRRGNHLLYSLMIYNASIRALDPKGLSMQVEILDGERALYQGPWQPVSSRLTGTVARGVELGGDINLDAQPGLYEFRITIRTGASKSAGQQSALFEVE